MTKFTKVLCVLLMTLAAKVTYAQCGPNGTLIPNVINGMVLLECTGKVGTAGYSQTFASSTGFAVTAATHGQGLQPYGLCYDNATPANLIPQTVNFPTVGATGTITFAWTGSKSGYCLISALGNQQGAPGSNGSPGSPGSNGTNGTNGSNGLGYSPATSSTSITVGTGSTTFTTQSGLAYQTGARVRVTSSGTGAYLEGLVTSYSGTSLVVNVDTVGGTGTHTDWNINIAGNPGGGGGSPGGVAGDIQLNNTTFGPAHANQNSDGSINFSKAESWAAAYKPTVNISGTTTCDYSQSNVCEVDYPSAGATTPAISGTHGSGLYILRSCPFSSGSSTYTSIPASWHGLVQPDPTVGTACTEQLLAIDVTNSFFNFGASWVSNSPWHGVTAANGTCPTNAPSGGGIICEDTTNVWKIGNNGGALVPFAPSATTDTTNASNIGSGTLPIARQDIFPDAKVILAANCVGTTAGSGWNSPASGGFTAVCRGGTNNLNGVLQAIPNTGAIGTIDFDLPLDWLSTNQPSLRVVYGSGANASGTVIWTAASACSKGDGSVSDDAAYVAESAMATQTMAVANRDWSTASTQFVNITSGNNCVAGGHVRIKLSLSGTALSNINVSQAVITTQRQLAAGGQ